MEEKEYYAFISYKREDEKWAKWLQHKLEHYKLPSNLNGRTDLPRQIRPIFRDTSELNPGNLPQQIHDALEASKYLIVICSPRSAQSEWVNREIETFIAMGKKDFILPFIIEGSPHAADPAEECFPSAILNLPAEQELLGANVGEMGRDAAVIKVVARMFGLKFDALWQRHEREQKRRYWMLVGGFVIFALVSLGIVGYIARQNYKIQINMSRVLAEKSLDLIDEGDSYLARLLALEALKKPYTLEAEIALRISSQSNNAIFKGHTNIVKSAQISPDGKIIVSTSEDSTIRIWDAETGFCKRTIYRHTSYINSVAFSPNSKRFVTASGDKSVRIWDSETGRQIGQTLMGHRSRVNSAYFSPDGDRVVSASDDSTIRVWDAKTSLCIKVLNDSSYDNSAAFSPDGKKVVSTSFDRAIRIWDVETGKCIRTIKHKYDFRTVAYRPRFDDQIISVSPHLILIWEAETGHCVDSLIIKDNKDNYIFHSAAYSPNGINIVTLSGRMFATQINIWEDLGRPRIIQSLPSCSDKVHSAVFSPDGKKILSTSYDKIILSEWETGLRLQGFNESEYEVNSAFSSDGKRVVSASRDSNVRIWDVEEKRCILTLRGHVSEVFSAVFSPDGSKVVSASRDETVRIWDAETGRCIRTLKGHTSDVYSAFFSPDGKIVASASFDKTIRIWDAETGICIRILEEEELVNAAVFSPDGKSIVSASYDHSISVWDVESGDRFRLKGHNSIVYAVAFSPDGKRIASASLDKTIRIWDVANCTCLRTIDKEAKTISFSPDGNRIVSTSNDKIVHIWDVESGYCVQSLEVHTVIQSAAFSPVNGNKIVLTGYYGVIYMWDFPSLQELIDSTTERFKNRQLTPEERRKYYLE